MNTNVGNYSDMQNNIILTDCDGVLCDWMYSFNAFMEMQGFKEKQTS